MTVSDCLCMFSCTVSDCLCMFSCTVANIHAKVQPSDVCGAIYKVASFFGGRKISLLSGSAIRLKNVAWVWGGGAMWVILIFSLS